MHLIKANIPNGFVDIVKRGLLALGITRLRVAEINGYTEGRATEVVFRGQRLLVDMLSEYELEAVVCEESVDEAVNLIIRTIGRDGDGFVCVTPIEQCYRIRTGARTL